MLNGGDDQGRLRLWDPSGKRWLEMSDRLSASEPEPEISAEDGAAAAEGGPPKPISQSVKLLELSADGRYAVSYGDDRRIKLWSVADRSIAAQSPILSEAVFSLKFSAEGMLIISGGEQSVRLWDVRALSDKPLLDLPIRAGNYMPGPIRSIAVSPRGRLFATGSGKFVQLWDLADLGAGATSPTRGASGAPMEHSAEVAALAFRGDGEVLASSAAACSHVQPTSRTRIHACARFET